MPRSSDAERAAEKSALARQRSPPGKRLSFRLADGAVLRALLGTWRHSRRKAPHSLMPHFYECPVIRFRCCHMASARPAKNMRFQFSFADAGRANAGRKMPPGRAGLGWGMGEAARFGRFAAYLFLRMVCKVLRACLPCAERHAASQPCRMVCRAFQAKSAVKIRVQNKCRESSLAPESLQSRDGCTRRRSMADNGFLPVFNEAVFKKRRCVRFDDALCGRLPAVFLPLLFVAECGRAKRKIFQALP